MSVVALGEVVEIRGGGTPSKSKPEFYTGDIPWVTPKDMKVWEISDAIDKITPEAVANSATNLIPKNTILLVNRSGILKHTLPVGITRRPVAINQDMKALICSARVHPEYLAHLVKAAEPTILKWVRATTADNFPIQNLKELKIPLPPLEEQKRIAGILDQADALRRLRTRALDKLNTLGQAIFHEMFGQDGETPRARIGDFSMVKGGKRLPKGSEYSLEPTAHPYIRVSDLGHQLVETKAIKYISPTIHQSIKRYIVHEGDVIISIAGSIGVTVAVPHMLNGANLTENAAKITPKEGAIFDATYLSWALSTPDAKAQISANTGQVTIGKLALFRIENLSVPMPDLDKQKAFSDTITSLNERTILMSKAQSKLETLFASLQHRAFRGEL